ncbi:MAG: sodium:solute symporter family protein, partial [Bacteroidetes bacterium]|nr:sodium:solute symporter family protein [Bacteroidota bacterium]
NPLIAIFDHGTPMDPKHPYIYIGALYNTFVCVAIGLVVALTAKQQKHFIKKLRDKKNDRGIMVIVTFIIAIIFSAIIFNVASLPVLLVLSLFLIALVALASTYFIKYDESEKTEGLTIWSIDKAKEFFKGGKINDKEGKIIKVLWKIKEDEDDDTINFSKNDMKKMSAEVGDLVYLCDTRKIFGGLKSIHSVYGKPHNEDSIVYITKDQRKTGIFVKGKKLTAEKEM